MPRAAYSIPEFPCLPGMLCCQMPGRLLCLLCRRMPRPPPLLAVLPNARLPPWHTVPAKLAWVVEALCLRRRKGCRPIVWVCMDVAWRGQRRSPDQDGRSQSLWFVPLAGVRHPFPSRTRPLRPPAAMIVRSRARESSAARTFFSTQNPLAALSARGFCVENRE